MGKTLAVIIFCIVAAITGISGGKAEETLEADGSFELSESIAEEDDQFSIVAVSVESEEVYEEYLNTIEDDIYLTAWVTVAEAEGESEEGQRLVVSTILNRVDSPHFPDSIRDVIYQPKQFSSLWNGRIERCEVNDRIVEIVREEIEMRSNNRVIFFDSGGYSKYGKPLFKVGNHYFSSYD